MENITSKEATKLILKKTREIAKIMKKHGNNHLDLCIMLNDNYCTFWSEENKTGIREIDYVTFDLLPENATKRN